MTRGGAAGGGLDHTTVLHRGAGELAGAMAGPLRQAVGRGEAVLASLAPETWAPLRDALGADAGSVQWLHADDRYATPAGAMVTLHRFVADALDAGAPAVWSLGTLGLDGSEADEPWIRYEHAVNAVLADLPLHAVCAYDLDATPASVLDRVHSAHGPCAAPVAVPLPPASPDLLAEPLVDVVVASPAAGRDLVGALDGRAPSAVLGDVRLVVSELVTNALRYGRPPIRLALGVDGGAPVVRVEDAGAGITDVYADLRPPRPAGDGGRGLNIVAQLARLHVGTSADGRAQVTAVLALA